MRFALLLGAAAQFQYGPFGALTVDQAVTEAAHEEEGQIEAQYYKDNAAAVAEWNKENKEVHDGEEETKAELAFTLPSLKLRGGLRATATPASGETTAPVSAAVSPAALAARVPAPVGLPPPA